MCGGNCNVNYPRHKERAFFDVYDGAEFKAVRAKISIAKKDAVAHASSVAAQLEQIKRQRTRKTIQAVDPKYGELRNISQ